MKRIRTFGTAFLLLFLLLQSTAWALPTAPLWIHDDDGRLGTYDIGTGALSVIGDMGVTMTDIAFDASGSLYGLSFTGFYSINPGNAAVSLIGNHGISGGNALVFGPNGTLYGAGTTTRNLFSIDTFTGIGTSLGSLGYYSSGDLAFNAGNFYLAADTGSNDTLVRIDQTTYTGTAVGNFGFNYVHGLATGDDGILYGLSGTKVLSINTSTGAGTEIADYFGKGMTASYGSSFITEARPIPEPSTLLLLGAGLLGLAGLSRRKFKVN